MAKEYVPIFFSWLKDTQDLTAEEKGNLIDAVVSYASGEEYEHLLIGGTKIAFRFLQGQVDRNNAISDVRSKARSGKTEETESNNNKKEQNTTNENKTEQNESKSIRERDRDRYKEKEKELNDRFDRFWAAYPRKVAKENARKAFLKINPNEEMMDVILRELERQKNSLQWTKDNGQFIPHPATWLNGKRYEDEAPVVKGNAAQNYEQRDYQVVQDEVVRAQNERILQRLADYSARETG